MLLLIALAAALLAGAEPVWAQDPPTDSAGLSRQRAPSRLAIQDVTVVDVESGRLIPSQTVLVHGNRITGMGASVSIQVPAGATVVDGRGRYVMPGLWDMHTHLNGSRTDSTALLPTYVANGVTGIRDLWSDPPGVWDDSARGITLLQGTQRLREHVRSGRLAGPRLLVSTAPLDGPFGPDEYTHVVRSADEARTVVMRGAADGVDVIAIYRWVGPDFYLAAAEAARERGLPLAGGMPIAATFAEAAAAGQRTRDGVLEWNLACSSLGDSVRAVLRDAARHDVRAKPADSAASMYRTFAAAGSRLRETFDAERCAEVARAVARDPVWQMPRLVYGMPTASGGRHAATAAPFLPDDERAAWAARVADVARDSAGTTAAQAAHEREIFRILHAAGIPFVVGTESYFGSSSAWGFSVHDELAELVGIGLSPAEALRAGTLEPARAMGIADSLGTVAVGKLADLVLLDANPLADIRNTTRIHAVVADGRLYDRAALDSLLEAARGAASPTTGDGYQPPPTLDDGWLTATPEELGLARAPLALMTETIRRGEEYRDVHALLVVKDGRLVYEQYFAGEDEHGRHGSLGHVVFGPETRHDIRSITKSVVSALVGIAVGSGAITSVDQPLLDFFPEYAELAAPQWRAITLRHALTMSAGVEWEEWGAPRDESNPAVRMNRSADLVRFVLERPIAAIPGMRWTYNGGLTQLLGDVVRRATGRPLVEFAQSMLFDPLGITDVEWYDNAGHSTPNASSGLRLRPRDLAKFGQLYAQGGRWGDRQVIPAIWVDESLRRHVALTDSLHELDEDSLSEDGYGFQWFHARYRLPYGDFTAHRAVGRGGQRVFIVPEQRLVAVVTSGSYDGADDSDRLMLERVLPWALGRGDTTYRFRPRAVRLVAGGEWPEAKLTPAEQARYVGTYRQDDVLVRVREEGGVLRIDSFPGLEGGVVHLIPMGNHVFAFGQYQDGRLTRIYWPDGRIEFRMAGGRVSGYVDRSESGQVFGTAERVP